MRTRDQNNAVHWEYLPPANLKGKSLANDNEDVSKTLNGKPKSETIGLNLPSSVFASEYEEDEGLLRKAAPHSGPRPDLEPEIVAALDDDFDFDNPANQLEDDFMKLAMGEKNDDEYDEDEHSDIGK